MSAHTPTSTEAGQLSPGATITAQDVRPAPRATIVEDATTATAGWIGFDLRSFQMNYKFNGHWSATSQLFAPPGHPPATLPVPFSTPEVPVLLPETIQRLTFTVQVKSTFAQAVFWKVRIKFFEFNNTQPITSTGFDPQGKPFHYGDGPVTEPVQPRATSAASFTPLSVEAVENVSPPSNLYQYQPHDLTLNVPIRMNLTVTAHASSPQTDANVIPDVGNANVLDVWIMRVATS